MAGAFADKGGLDLNMATCTQPRRCAHTGTTSPLTHTHPYTRTHPTTPTRPPTHSLAHSHLPPLPPPPTHTHAVVGPLGKLMGFAKTLDQAGEYTMAAAFADKGGLYFDMGTKPGDTSKESKDDELAKQLWEYTEGLIAEKTSQ